MTDETSDGQAVVSEPKSDPMKEAIAAMAGRIIPNIPPAAPSTATTREAWTEGERAAAQDAYIKAGTAKVMAALGSDEIVSRATLPAILEALLLHLHQDHPDNYLP